MKTLKNLMNLSNTVRLNLMNKATTIIETVEKENNEKIEFLATQVINDKDTLSIHKPCGNSFEFNRNDAIEETLDKDWVQEMARNTLDFVNHSEVREQYADNLIEYTGDMIEHWLNNGYEVFIKV